MTRRHGRGRILLVEERGALRNLIRRVFEDAGYRVTLGAELEDALRQLSEKGLPVDLVVLDPVTGRSSGHDPVDEIHRLAPGCRVVLVSDPEAPARFRQEPTSEWMRTIPRPVKLSELFEAVESLLGPAKVDHPPTDGTHSDRRDVR